jgi:hypothetical protein
MKGAWRHGSGGGGGGGGGLSAAHRLGSDGAGARSDGRAWQRQAAPSADARRETPSSWTPQLRASSRPGQTARPRVADRPESAPRVLRCNCDPRDAGARRR